MAQRSDDIFDDAEQLASLGRCLARFISDQATDPHLNFANRIASAFSVSLPADQARPLIADLIRWIGALEPTEQQLQRLDSVLADQGLPNLSVMRSRLQHLDGTAAGCE